MRKIKRGKSPYDYIEIMACPKGASGRARMTSAACHWCLAAASARRAVSAHMESLPPDCQGCTNGGGQLRDDDKADGGEEATTTLAARTVDSQWEATESLYHELP